MILPDYYPALTQSHLEGAKLYADRSNMIADLMKPGGSVAELGVAHGAFSAWLLDTLQPKDFLAVDIFDMEKYPVLWGTPSSELFEGKTHFDFYRDKFGDRARLKKGASWDMLAEEPDEHFDLIYIDAGHDYEDVQKDAAVALRKIKKDGLIVFNDYTMVDHNHMGLFGVVQAANEFIVDHGWKVVGMSLHFQMYCDLAVRRA